MDLTAVLAFIALVFALGSIHKGVQIANFLRARGYGAKPLLVRWFLHRYMADYKRVTLEESGQVGPLYGQCLTLLRLTLIFGLSAILTKVLH